MEGKETDSRFPDDGLGRGKYLNANKTRFVLIIKKTFPFLLYFLTTSFVWSFEVNKKSKLIPD